MQKGETILLYICLFVMEAAAVCFDLRTRKIPNPLTAGGLIAGAAYQWSAKGPPGLKSFAAGALLPLVLLGGLHYFHMLGAGDIKLLMAAGGFLGPGKCLNCILLSFLCAAAISVAVLVKHRILVRRLKYFCQYIQHYLQNGEWSPYIKKGEDEAYLHFSVPIFAGTILLLGGVF